MGAIFFGWLSRSVDQLIPYLGVNKTGVAWYVLCLFNVWMTVRPAQNLVVFSYYIFAFMLIIKVASFRLKKEVWR